MRPRVFAAEDLQTAGHHPPVHYSFNEAAGIRRGRRLLAAGRHESDEASMRPRVFAAEDTGRRPCRRGSTPGFNEAAGIRRGRLAHLPRDTRGARVLQ